MSVTTEPGPPSEVTGEGSSVPRRVMTALSIGIALGLVGLLAFGLTRKPGELPSALVGRRAPDFALADMDGGRTLRLQEFRGRVVVLNFWASWCTACRREHPGFVAAWERYRGQEVALLGVLFQDTPENARAYMAELGGGWPTLLDPGSRVAVDYGVYGVPETFFIDRAGRIAHKQVGESSYPLLVARIEELLPEGAGAGRG